MNELDAIRTYVSRWWDEDWASPEDKTYDHPHEEHL